MDQAFQLRFVSRQLAMQSKRSEKSARKEIVRLKGAIKKDDTERTTIYAENVIRYKNQALQYLRLSSRVDAVSARVEAASRMKQVTASMHSVATLMERAMASMNLEAITRIMENFETQFENMDVQSSTVEEAMQQTSVMSTPQNQVNSLITLVAEENNLELGAKLSEILPGRIVKEQEPIPQSQVQDSLTERLSRLKS